MTGLCGGVLNSPHSDSLSESVSVSEISSLNRNWTTFELFPSSGDLSRGVARPPFFLLKELLLDPVLVFLLSLGDVSFGGSFEDLSFFFFLQAPVACDPSFLQ